MVFILYEVKICYLDSGQGCRIPIPTLRPATSITKVT